MATPTTLIALKYLTPGDAAEEPESGPMFETGRAIDLIVLSGDRPDFTMARSEPDMRLPNEP